MTCSNLRSIDLISNYTEVIRSDSKTSSKNRKLSMILTQYIEKKGFACFFQVVLEIET